MGFMFSSGDINSSNLSCCICIDIDNIWDGVKYHFSHICHRVLALVDVRSWFPLNILGT